MKHKKVAVKETSTESVKTTSFTNGLAVEKKSDKKKVLVRCPHCPWKAGMKDEQTVCDVCKGSGQVEADPLE